MTEALVIALMHETDGTAREVLVLWLLYINIIYVIIVNYMLLHSVVILIDTYTILQLLL